MTRIAKEVRVGVMVEVPSLAVQIAGLAGRADFVSVDVNNLARHCFASHLNSSRLANW